MSIVIKSKDVLLDRMLLLEAKRCGFCEECAPPLYVVTPEALPLTEADRGALVLAITADPEGLNAAQKNAVYATLSLPFSVKEFEQTVHRFRQYGPANAVHREGEQLRIDGQRVALSRTELRLFDLLYTNRHRVVSEAEMQAVLGENAAKTNTVAVYLYRLRRKLSVWGIALRTVRGEGCQWLDEGR